MSTSLKMTFVPSGFLHDTLQDRMALAQGFVGSWNSLSIKALRIGLIKEEKTLLIKMFSKHYYN
jgi:hypothetical protein